METQETKYTFGDTPTADDRLKRIASFFNPQAENFIRPFLNGKVDIALDLGCGPGHTTSMLANVTKANKVVGLDFSEKFIESANRHYTGLEFKVHDVTQTPFPMNANIIYCRFLQSHLNNTEKVINSWMNELMPGGMLFIDELENIKTENEDFNFYLEIGDKLIASQGANLYIGDQINRDVKNLNVLYNESIILPVKNHMAAWWFYPNTVSIWKTSDFVKDLVTDQKREQIARKFFDMAENKSEQSDITWIMKRIVIKK